MGITINTFSPNTKAESSKVNQNFTNIKTAIDQLQVDKVLSALVDDTTVTLDLSTSKMFTLNLADISGNNRTLAITNAVVGQGFMVRLVQAGTSAQTVTWWGGIKWPSAQVPLLTTTAGSIDVFGFVCTAANNYDGLLLGFDLR